MSAPTPFDSAAVRFAGDAQIDAWYSARDESFGALLRVPIEAQILGGVTALEGVAEAVYLKEENRNILFGSLTQDVEVVGFRERASAWVSYDQSGSGGNCEGESGCWSLGMGQADNALSYRAKLDAVQAQVESLEIQAAEMAGVLERATDLPTRLRSKTAYIVDLMTGNVMSRDVSVSGRYVTMEVVGPAQAIVKAWDDMPRTTPPYELPRA